MSTAEPLWSPGPERISASAIERFRREAQARTGRELPDTVALHQWSVGDLDGFWRLVWDHARVIGDRGEPAFVPGLDMHDARWFPQARLNFAENVLAAIGPGPAVQFVREDGERRSLTRDQLLARVRGTAAGLRRLGVGPGDRVVAWMPNVPETVVAMLAATAIGAVFSSTSPDFGVDGVLDRFGQIGPAVLFAADGYVYGGRRFDCLERLVQIVERLPGLRAVVVHGELEARPDLAGLPGARPFDEFWSAGAGESLEFERWGFDHPGFILYSSGTTGPPKCIVHRAGGLLLKHRTEHQLHCDIRASDTVFFFTTCGWMMWNWLTSVLAVGARIVLYDGSPFHPRPTTLFDLADDLGVTLFGVSAKFIDAVAKAGAVPMDTHRLESVRTIASTGSPLSAEAFEYVYRRVKADVHLASISGGTDLCGCFVMGDPTRPVWAGEIQGPALGMRVDVWGDDGRTLPSGKGELVCTQPFPSMPVAFWGDADGSRYRRAYFERFPGVWAHGDFASWTEHGGMVIHGRSDATLNASGVRIGTAEIYRQVERLPEIAESLAIGQEWDGDTRIVLFVRMAAGHQLDDALRDRIRRTVREHCSPRHVPARIVEVADLPRTRSGKLVELAAADVVHGRPVRNREALANPEALDALADLIELRR